MNNYLTVIQTPGTSLCSVACIYIQINYHLFVQTNVHRNMFTCMCVSYDAIVYVAGLNSNMCVCVCVSPDTVPTTGRGREP